MTLVLENGTLPEGLETKATGPTVLVGEYKISLVDFLILAEYVLTNTDLEPNDLRLLFIERVVGSECVAGWNKGAERLVLHGPMYTPPR